MNTITSSHAGLLTTEAAYFNFRREFRLLAHARKLTAEHMALHAILTGKPLGKAFSPITNTNKLANGQSAWGNALYEIHRLARNPDASCFLLCDAQTLEKAQVIARACTTASLAAGHDRAEG